MESGLLSRSLSSPGLDSASVMPSPAKEDEETLQLEAQAWERGDRDLARISRIWSEEFHDINVASGALELFGLRS